MARAVFVDDDVDVIWKWMADSRELIVEDG
jgi:hypothetical protein